MKNKIISFLLILFLLLSGVGCSVESLEPSENDEQKQDPDDIVNVAEDVRLESVFCGQNIDLCASELRIYLDEQDAKKQCAFLIDHEGKNFDYQAPVFRWAGEKDKSFIVYFSENNNFSTVREIVTDQHYLRADIFEPNKKYYWKVKGLDSKQFSETDSFVTEGLPARIVTVDGLHNVRDIGGWGTESGDQVKYNMIYRGSQLNGYNQGPQLTVKGRLTMVQDLKIKSEMDFRKPNRDDGGQIKCYIDESYPYLKTPFYPYTCIFPQSKSNKRGYDSRVPKAFEQIFSFLSDKNNYPVYLHCNAGADRTGTILFLLNGLLGVSYEDLTKDFELTSFSAMGKRWRTDLSEVIPLEEGVMQDDEDNYVAWGKMYNMMMRYYGTDSGKLSDAISNYLVQVCNVSLEQQKLMKDILLRKEIQEA